MTSAEVMDAPGVVVVRVDFERNMLMWYYNDRLQAEITIKYEWLVAQHTSVRAIVSIGENSTVNFI